MANENQFTLLKKPRFAPFFWTQFFGAFNDNIFKNALLILIGFHAATWQTLTPGMLINIAQGLFILPFFLFSATAGQIAEKYEKSQLIRYIKWLEVMIMVLAALAFYLNNIWLLIFILFLLGTQATLFGPVKYSILPQHLKLGELVGGNGLVESSTFIAILLGSILGGILIGSKNHPTFLINTLIIVCAFIGIWFAYRIPKAPANDAELIIGWNPFKETWRNIQLSRQKPAIFLAILGISWFWFYGALVLGQVVGLTKIILHGNEQVATLLLACFAIGIGIGSLLCEKLSDGAIEIGLVPLGSLGLSIFAIAVWKAGSDYSLDSYTYYSAWSFILQSHHWRFIITLILMGVSGGLYTVPLYAYLQARTPTQQRSRIIAASNIIGALWMVIAALAAVFFLAMGLTIPQIFLVLGILNFIVAAYIYSLLPEFVMRLLAWMVINILYRIRCQDLDNIPDEGPAVLICNHVSFVDGLIIGACSRRPVRFVMDYAIFKFPLISWIFRASKVIPIAPAKENPMVKEQAFAKIAECLRDGDLLCIFPEGGITPDGEIREFKQGIERIIQETPVPVIPCALCGLWGSFFSRKDGPAMRRWPRRFRSHIMFKVGKPIAPTQISAPLLQQHVQQLRGDWQ